MSNSEAILGPPASGGDVEISEFFKYIKYVIWSNFCQNEIFTLILLWTIKLGSNQINSPAMPFLPTNLAFQTRTYISNFP